MTHFPPSATFPAPGRISLVDYAEIHRLSERRSAIWSGRVVTFQGETQRIAARLAELYEEKRHALARDRSGRSRDDIVRGARIEAELERLTSGRTT